MADKKSCEGKMKTLECMNCGHRETFSERQFKMTCGMSCEECKGPTIPSQTKPGEEISNRRDGGVVVYECLLCGHNDKIRVQKKDYSEVRVCLECGGSSVDLFKIHKYKQRIKSADEKTDERKKLMDKAVEEFAKEHGLQFPPSRKAGSIGELKIDIDVSDALKGLKAVQREAKKTARALKEVEGYRNIEKMSDDDILQKLSKRGWEIEEDRFTSVNGETLYYNNVKMRKIYNE